MPVTACPKECSCGKHSARNAGQFRSGTKRFKGPHTEAAKALIREKRAQQENVRGGGPTPTNPALRFFAKIRIDGQCWHWTGARQKNGYGAFATGSMKDGTRAVHRAHRWAWERINGPVPAGLELDHLCRVRHCVNPAHLEAVTHSENLRRRDSAHRKGE